jgi:hypothetical protein
MTYKIEEVQRTRPTTAVVTTRCDQRTVATLLLFWHLKDEHPRSLSELLRLSLETLGDIVRSNHPELNITSTSQARQVLFESGMGDLTSGKRKNRGNLVNQLELEDMAAEGINPSFVVRTKHGPGKQMSKAQVTDFQVDAATKLLRSQMADGIRSMSKVPDELITTDGPEEAA